MISMLEEAYAVSNIKVERKTGMTGTSVAVHGNTLLAPKTRSIGFAWLPRGVHAARCLG